jgi:hypothetical protein
LNKSIQEYPSQTTKYRRLLMTTLAVWRMPVKRQIIDSRGIKRNCWSAFVVSKLTNEQVLVYTF